MKKQGLKIRAALFLVTAALASSPVLTSVAAATKKDVSSAKDKKSALEQEKKKTEEAIKSLQGLKSNTESYVKELDTKMNDLQSQVTKLENNISSKQKCNISATLCTPAVVLVITKVIRQCQNPFPSGWRKTMRFWMIPQYQRYCRSLDSCSFGDFF